MSVLSPMPPTDSASAKPNDERPREGVVLVTGAAGGIGRAIVAALLETGRRVVATDVDEAGLAALTTALGAADHLHARPLDVTISADVDDVVDRVEGEIGPIEGLVSAHGMLRASTTLAQSDEEWEAVHAVNVGGVMRISRAVTRRMARRQRGAVVTIGSNAAAVARDGISAYASSKAAARHYTLCLGVELAPLGIRCNVVSPGSTDTPMLRGAWTDSDADAAGLPGAANRRAIAGTPEAFWPGIPLGRVSEPEWVADAVTFLLSPSARHIALHDLRVDGGATLGA